MLIIKYLLSITIPTSVTRVGHDVFGAWWNIESVYINDIATWCDIDFYNQASNPLFYAKYLYVNGVLTTDVVIQDTVTSISDHATLYAGTGAVVSIKKDGVIHSQYTLVVGGDTNGDSICDVLDCFSVERASNGNEDLSGVYEEAGDISCDGTINITDYQMIVNKAIAS